MRIAQVAPLHESVPPRLYGGTERVVSFLTEELVRQGHEVTLFASGDSVTRAQLVAPVPRALRLDLDCIDRVAPHVLMLDDVVRRASEFDVLHFHCDYLHFPMVRTLSVPSLTTLHGRLDGRDFIPVLERFRDVPLTSISMAQRGPAPWARWVGNVPHGLPSGLFGPVLRPGGYLVALGRISPEKGMDRAIEIAGRVGMPLRIAAKVDPADRDYYEQRIRPMLRRKGVEWLGEICERDKQALLGGAHALLFPIDWPEPFGLVMIEAMACGTPVIAYPRGSVPEVVRHGVSGWIVDGIPAAVAAVKAVGRLSRSAVRREFEERFTAERMARDYLGLYRRLAVPDWSPSRMLDPPVQVA